MQTTTSRLHPLLTIAAISVTVLAAIGVASLTGMIPSSKGQDNVLELPKDVAKPLEPAISHPFTEAPRVAEAPAVVQETPKPQLPVGQLAVVESVREVKEPGDAKGVGAVAGGVAGSVLEEKVTRKDAFEITVRLDEGRVIAVTQPAGKDSFKPGERVRVVSDGRTARVAR